VNAAKSVKLDGFLPVAVATLRSATNLDFDLYFPPEPHRVARLYRDRRVPCTAADFDRLLRNGQQTLYVPCAMAQEYRDHLRQHVLNDESINVRDRYQLLRDAARVTFHQALKSGDSTSITSIAHDLGDQLAQLLNRSDLLLSDLVTVMVHDYSTYTHVTHVSTYSVMLASQLGIKDLASLTEIAKGGLLHDIGKRFISVDILEKPGRLDIREQRVIRDHPRSGFAELCLRQDISWGALMMVYQHHERYAGGGYPVGSMADEIHPWARICAIADVFDAMSSNRAYHAGESLSEVQKYFQQQAGQAFDKEMVECWNSMIENALLPS
jgi:HD-GYP domain-containing protein (c-di-GMP phosphodiesterase class II)